MPEGGKQIIVLGGGMGALTAAYYLTDQPGWKQNYDVTVYQLGWRLGGKCASSRNAQHNHRIEEHGLHVWFGFYQNAFALLRGCYAELGLSSPLDPTQGVFEPRDEISMLESEGSRWAPWGLEFPLHDGEPGAAQNPEPNEWSVLRELVRFVVTYAERWVSRALAVPVDFGVDVERGLADMALLEANALAGDDATRDSTLALLRRIRDAVNTLPDLPELLTPPDLLRGYRRMKLVADMCLTAAIGILQDRLLETAYGLAHVDNQEFAAWLRAHGARPATADIERNAPLRALYDTCFAFDEGDVRRPNFAAGSALGVVLRIGLTYWGHVLYLMREGMGDVVIAPLYEVLRQRGVKFEFFHRITAIEPDAAGTALARIRYVRQARPIDAEYEPLIRQGNRAWWPETPRYDGLRNGNALVGIDFESHWYDKSHDEPESVLNLGANDQVVLGISLGALRDICAPLANVSPQWQQLLQGLPSIQTQSMQLWFDRTAQEMGRTEPAPAAMVAAPEPHDVWADMSHVLAREGWPAGQAPKSLHYLCGPMAGDYLRSNPPDAPQRARDEVRAVAIDWL